MNIFRSIKETFEDWGPEDWLWWLLIVPLILVGAMKAYNNGQLLDDLGGVVVAVIVTLIGVPISIVIVHSLMHAFQRNRDK